MSEIYLTKIERKTIFTKALIFVLIMFVISDLTVTGPFWFNFVPWLYILGTLGSLKKVDSTLLCIIGTFTVFVASTIMSAGMWSVVILSTIIALITSLFGVITGKILYQFVLEHRLVKYIRKSLKTVYIASIIAMTVLSFVLVGMHSGNVITYGVSRANLKAYISDTYDVEEFKIVSTRYNRQAAGKYVYVVEIDGEEVYFVPISKEIFKDVNKAQRLETLNLKLEQNTRQEIDKIKDKYELLKDATVGFSLEYTRHGISPDTLVMTISCSTSDKDTNTLYEEISKCIKDVVEYKMADTVVITIDNQTLKVAKTNITNINSDYIMRGFQIENISDL